MHGSHFALFCVVLPSGAFWTTQGTLPQLCFVYSMLPGEWKLVLLLWHREAGGWRVELSLCPSRKEGTPQS